MTWLYFVQTGIYQVILCTAWDILRNTTLYLESDSSRLVSPFCLGCPLASVPCIACDFLPLPSLLDGQAPKAGLAAPKLPQPRVDFVVNPWLRDFFCTGTGRRERSLWICGKPLRSCPSRPSINLLIAPSMLAASCPAKYSSSPWSWGHGLWSSSSGPQSWGSGAVEGSCIIASRCAPRNPAHNSISEYIPVYTCIYLSVHSIKQYIPVCTVPGQVYPSIYQYTLVYTGLYTVYLGIYYSVQSLDKSQGLSRGLKRVVKRYLSARLKRAA